MFGAFFVEYQKLYTQRVIFKDAKNSKNSTQYSKKITVSLYFIMFIIYWNRIIILLTRN